MVLMTETTGMALYWKELLKEMAVLAQILTETAVLVTIWKELGMGVLTED